MLWDELHTRQPGGPQTAGGELLSFPGEAQKSSTLLLVIAINTVRIPALEPLALDAAMAGHAGGTEAALLLAYASARSVSSVRRGTAATVT